MRDWLMHIRRDNSANLQTQIRETLVSAILDGQLAQEEPIPSTRKMAKGLGVSRNTVVLAYQALLDDGYLMARERSGYFVSEKALSMPDAKPPQRRQPNGAPLEVDWASRIFIQPSQKRGIDRPLDWQNYRYPFIYGQVDHDLFPLTEWRECSRQALGKRWLGNWTNDTWEFDDPLLVEQIRRRILPRRGIMAKDEEILVTLGAQNALYLIASLLVRENTRVAIENPGFPDARHIFGLKTEQLIPAEIDHDGLKITRAVGESDAVFVTPSHQFPSTVTMPLERRLELLSLAHKNDMIVIEDDYEFETNYVNEPCPALKSLDDDGRVLYIGSLSKSLFPGLRLGFLVGPAAFIREARALRRLMVRHAPNNNQRTAALFLSLGHHDSLIRRLHRIYRERWEVMGRAIARHLPASAQTPSFGGTSYWVEGPKGLNSHDLSRTARENGILIEPGADCFADRDSNHHYFRLGFSSIDTARIEPGIELLAELMGRG